MIGDDDVVKGRPRFKVNEDDVDSHQLSFSTGSIEGKCTCMANMDVILASFVDPCKCYVPMFGSDVGLR
jgi:hypothetical protein